jgi:hypothetical protein
MNDSEKRLVFLVSQFEKVLVEARTNQELLKTIILKLDKLLPAVPPLNEQEFEEHFDDVKKLCADLTKYESNRDLREFLPGFDELGPDNDKN